VRENFEGFIQVYTGNGKGKTTAALGLALRAAGHGFSTFIGQFLKGQRYGELKSVRRLSPLITIRQYGHRGFVHVTDNPCDEDIRRARRGFEQCFRAMLSGKYRIVVLDEINVALHFRLLERQDVERLLDRKPAEVELVLTGRYAPPWLVRRADLVTEMKDRKHYYDKGVRARIGIEK
jgi:cob(I)alamin adenosyltransferase